MVHYIAINHSDVGIKHSISHKVAAIFPPPHLALPLFDLARARARRRQQTKKQTPTTIELRCRQSEPTSVRRAKGAPRSPKGRARGGAEAAEEAIYWLHTKVMNSEMSGGLDEGARLSIHTYHLEDGRGSVSLSPLPRFFSRARS
jgi:hypothetical protein